ncbi:CopG family transcriptional regulator [Halobacteriales archaeon QS_4_62_28]|nr:MAG: CopG family transcriptional regulator [Halobacteriales archaeon QS_4_62_28]
MASESREEQSVSLDLAAELDEWLDQQAKQANVSRDDIVRQLLRTYHATESLDEAAVGEIEETVRTAIETEATKATRAAVSDHLKAELPERLDGEIEDRVTDVVTTQVETAVEDRVEQVVENRLADAVETAIADKLPNIADAVEGQLDEQLSGATAAVEAQVEQLDEKTDQQIEDVRERVIQVKKETDGKAPADHTHEVIERLDDAIEESNADLLAARDDLDALDERVAETDETVADVVRRVEDAEDKLKRVAWVVSDLRDEISGRDSHQQAVERIKRAAAQEGITSASCENCSESVAIALLTDPECPHCNAAVADVRPEGGLFRSTARLVTAAELESGAPEHE